jgi:hypothetical protein
MRPSRLLKKRTSWMLVVCALSSLWLLLSLELGDPREIVLHYSSLKVDLFLAWILEFSKYMHSDASGFE